MKKKKNLSELIVIVILKLIKYLFIFLILFFIFYTIIYNCFAIFAKKEYIQIGNLSFVNTKTNTSMDNEIKKWDLLIAKKVNLNDIEVGDIIVYINGTKDNGKEMIKIQRVNDILNDNGKVFLQTKGDNNLYPNEEKVTEDNIIGKIIIKIPILGILKIR